MIVRQLEALPAGTLKRSFGVAADSILTDVLVIALVDVDAALSVLGERVALLALALEAPDGVATPAVVAHPELGAALVHIYQNERHPVNGEIASYPLLQSVIGCNDELIDSVAQLIIHASTEKGNPIGHGAHYKSMFVALCTS